MGNDTIRKTRGKHYTVEDLRRMFEAYERSLCRKNPRPLSWITRGLGVPDSSFRDFIARTQTCLPSRFGNKRLQRFSLDMRKDASWLPEKGKRKRVNPSERKGRVAKRCPPPGHSILDMPETLLCRQQTFGVWEMDTVHSCRGGKGGLLTLTERQTRKSYAVKLPEISQEAVCAALKKLMRQKKLKTVKALLTDNGSEFLCTAALERIVRALINHISRTTSLKGLSANEAFSAIA